MRVFLTDSSSYLGKVLKRSLSASHEIIEPVFVMENKGDEDEAPAEQGEGGDAHAPKKSSVKETISLWKDEAKLKEMLLSAELIILDLVRSADKANTILNLLKEVSSFESDVNVIAVSSIMSWASTNMKKGKLLDEKEYKSRKTSAKYKNLKLMETLVINSQREGMNTCVISSGILYGAGEEDMFAIFQDAWMCENESITMIGEGNNTIPTIHVADLAAVVEAVGGSFPGDQQYVVATDKSNMTQKQIVEAIAKGLGTGKVNQIAADDENVTSVPNHHMLLLNLKFDPEKSLQNSMGVPLTFENGLAGDAFEKVRMEFVKERDLRPLRVMMHGPPGAGKTHFAKKLAAHYYLPHVSMLALVDETIAAGDELSELIQNCLSEQNDAAKGGAKKKKAPPPKKGKGKGKGAVETPGPKIPLDLMMRMLKKKLRGAACRNKGYILDGFPETLAEASALFKKEALAGEGGEEAPPADGGDDEAAAPAVETDPTTMIDFVISLDCTEEVATERLKALDESEIIADHNDEEAFSARWAKFESVNDTSVDPIESPLAFLKDIEILELPMEMAQDEEGALSSMRLYLEKQGKPLNFHPTAAELAEEKAVKDAAELEAKKNQEADLLLKEQTAKEEFLQKERSAQIRKEQVLMDDEELVQACSLPLRKYLMSNVVPPLVDGLLEVTKVQPEDPIDFLAEFLFKYSVGSEAQRTGIAS